jgi:hypothetical protein
MDPRGLLRGWPYFLHTYETLHTRSTYMQLSRELIRTTKSEVNLCKWTPFPVLSAAELKGLNHKQSVGRVLRVDRNKYYWDCGTYLSSLCRTRLTLAARSGERWQCFVSLPWLRELFSVLLIWVRLSRAELARSTHSRCDSKQSWGVTCFHYVQGGCGRILYAREQKYKRHASSIAAMVLPQWRDCELRVGLASDDTATQEKCTHSLVCYG